MSSTQQTINRLRELRLSSMAKALEDQMNAAPARDLSFEDRLALLIEHEFSTRTTRKLTRLVRNAGFPEPAQLEDLDRRPERGLDMGLIASLSTGEWVGRKQNIIIIGATGLGKTWLGSALGTQVCRQGVPVRCYIFSDLLSDIAAAILDGSLGSLKKSLLKPAVLYLDDFGMGGISIQAAHVLLDIVDRRMRTGSVLITSQYPVDKWHSFFPEDTVADAILDRVVHQAHRITMKGESMRKIRSSLAS